MAAEPAWEVDEWELCNDDGFVYKRRKRRRQEGSIASASAAAAAAADQEAELRKRKRAHKKQTLMKLRDQYQREIDHWEQLSNTLRDMKDTTNQHHHHHQHPSSSAVPQQIPQSYCRAFVDNLHLQVEAQEAIIQDLTNLCNTAEAMCKAEEERFKQSLFDLPVWASPHALLASLSDPDDSNNDENAQIT